MLRRTLLLPSLLAVAACSGGESPTMPAASIDPNAPVHTVTAKGIAYDVKELSVPAGQAFTIHLKNDDPSTVPHDVDIRQENGTTVVQDNATVDGGHESSFAIKGLPAGTYRFMCSIHPVPAMTGTLTVK